MAQVFRSNTSTNSKANGAEVDPGDRPGHEGNMASAWMPNASAQARCHLGDLVPGSCQGELPANQFAESFEGKQAWGRAHDPERFQPCRPRLHQVFPQCGGLRLAVLWTHKVRLPLCRRHAACAYQMASLITKQGSPHARAARPSHPLQVPSLARPCRSKTRRCEPTTI